MFKKLAVIIAIIIMCSISAHSETLDRASSTIGSSVVIGVTDDANKTPMMLRTDTSGYLKINKHEWNGTAWVAELTPTVFKVFDVAVCATETTIWTPATGKKFRLMGYTGGTSAAGTIALKDNTGGTSIFTSRTGTSIPFSSDLKRGILSATANNVLTITSSGAASCTGTVWGIEE